MELPTTGLIPEIERARQRVAKAPVLDAKSELVDNVYPLLHMIAEMSGQVMMAHEERIGTAEIAIAELATVGESIVLPELAQNIDAVLSVGLLVCECIAKLEGHVMIPDELETLVKKYRDAVEELRAELDDVTLEDEDDVPGDGEQVTKDEG